ncbi:MAG: TraR/DksA family transcriptional regulator [Planctomycetota bacterium]
MGEKWSGPRAWLLLRLQELSDGVVGGMDALAAGGGHHLADLEELASDVTVDSMLFEQFRSSADTIAQIERALRRIDEGSYEDCEDCDEAIGDERLAALPFATQCVDCRRRAEQEEASSGI